MDFISFIHSLLSCNVIHCIHSFQPKCQTSTPPPHPSSLLFTPYCSSLLLFIPLPPHHPTSLLLTPPHPPHPLFALLLISHQSTAAAPSQPLICLVKPPSQSSQCTHAKLAFDYPSTPPTLSRRHSSAGSGDHWLTQNTLLRCSFPWCVRGFGQKEKNQALLRMPVLRASLHPLTPDRLRFVWTASSRRRGGPAAVGRVGLKMV